MPTKPLVYVSRQIPTEGLEDLYKYCQVVMHKKRTPPDRAAFLANAKKAAGLLTLLTEKVGEEVFRSSPFLKIVANYAIGFDNIDLKAAERHGVFVSNTPGDLAGVVAEHALALLLSLAKRVGEGDRFVRQGRYKAWDPLLLLGHDVRGKILGTIGVGRIGSVLVKMAAAGLGMKILYTDVIVNKEIEQKYGAKKVGLRALLRAADFVSVHVPLLPSTRHLLGERQLALMKPTAYLINTARGPVLDEKSLVRALKSGKIAGAGLDVFEFEPKLTAGLSSLENVILTPHIASATYAARREMGQIAGANIIDVLIKGKKPRNEVKA